MTTTGLAHFQKSCSSLDGLIHPKTQELQPPVKEALECIRSALKHVREHLASCVRSGIVSGVMRFGTEAITRWAENVEMLLPTLHRRCIRAFGEACRLIQAALEATPDRQLHQ